MTKLALIVGCMAAMFATSAMAQREPSIAEIDRTQGREAALKAIRERQARQQQNSPYARRDLAPITNESQYAAVTLPRACSPNMAIQLRLKQNRSAAQLSRPDYYMAMLNGALPFGASMGAEECTNARLTVSGPDGQIVTQDTLTYTNREWTSDRANQAERALADSAPTSASFGPGGAGNLNDVLRARQAVAEKERQACFARQQAQSEALRLERQRRGIQGYGPADVAPGSPADRIQQELRACVARSEAAPNDIHANMIKAASDFAARQPVSYDGLRALKTAKQDYRKTLGTDPRVRGGAQNQQALGEINAVLNARAAAIETALRPQIVADLNRAEGTGLIDDLFGMDERRVQAYAPDIYPASYISRLPKRTDGSKPFYLRAGETDKSRREATQAASWRTWSEPTDIEIGLAMQRGLLMTGGRRINANVVTVPGGMNRIGFDQLDGLSGMQMQIFDVRKGACAKASEGYRCSYTIYSRLLGTGAYGGEALGMLSALGVSPQEQAFGARSETLFTPTADGWRIYEREADVTRGQANQLQQIGKVVEDVAEAGTNAMSVVGDAVNPQADNSPEARREREERQRRGTDF